MDKKNVNIGLIIIIVILLIICIAMGAFIIINKDNLTAKSNTSITEKNEKKKTTEKIIKENDCNKQRCYGTYYVNGDSNDDAYILKEDGTYHVENQEKKGVFIINENTITMIESKHTVGPRNEDPFYYNPQSYLISDDCSKIRLTDSDSHISAYLEKAN